MFGKIKKNKKVTYELRNKHNEVKYIGETNNPGRRFYEHKKDGKDFSHLKVTSKPLSKRDAKRKETRDLFAFKRTYNEKPKLNKTWNGKYNYRRKVYGYNQRTRKGLDLKEIAIGIAVFIGFVILYKLYIFVKTNWVGILITVAIIAVVAGLGVYLFFHLKTKKIQKLLNEANKHCESERYNEAIKCFKKAIELDPKDPAAYHNRGVFYNIKGEYDKAINDLNKAVELSPKNAEVYYTRGLFYYTKKEYDKAIADFNKAVELSPKNAEVYYTRGLFYYTKKEYDKAITDLNKAIELNLQHGAAYSYRGSIYYIKEEYDKAIIDYNKALELNPRDMLAYHGKENSYKEKEEHDKTETDFNKAIELDPKNKDFK